MKTLTAILIGIVISPISALISAGTMSKLWEWFVFRDYGDGPSMAAWFGLNVILGVAIAPSFLGLAKEPNEDKESPIARVIIRTISIWIGFAFILCTAWLVGLALHWH